MLETNKIYLGDCLEIMKNIDDKSIDMVLCDLPYNTTRLKWDCLIPFEKLWEQYERIIKDNGAIVLFGSEPFSSLVRTSNLKLYKYDWIWEKTAGSNFLQANYQPIKRHENIMVFSKYNASYSKNGNKMNYFPILNKEGKVYSDRPDQKAEVGLNAWKEGISKNYKFKRNKNKGTFPVSILKFQSILKNKLHATQKPEALYNYLAETYTNENDIILDNCCGSGTIKIVETIGRSYIGIEKDQKYYEIAVNRKIS